MSIELMTEIRDRIFDSPTEKLVAMRLADFADDDGAAIYPKRATVADDCLISERRIRSIFSKFIELGLLVVVKEARGHRQRTYCLKPNVLRGLPLTRAAVARRARKEGRRQTAKGEADGLPKGHRGEADGPPRREADGPPIRTTSRKHQSIEAETSIEDGREVFALASPEPLPQKRGNRLPASWQSTDRDLAFAISEGLTEQEAQREADQFRDFWIAAAGAKAVKRDWAAAWQSRNLELGLLEVVKEARGHRQRTYCLKPNVLRGLPLTRAAVARRARKEGRRQTAKGEADGLPKGHRGEADGPPRREADGPPIRTTSRKHQSIEAETSIEDGREVFALASPEPLPQKRGNRLPASWQSTDRDLAFAISEGLTEQEAQREADQFRDFWIAAAGAKASSETGPPRGEPGFATPLIGGALQAADPVDTDRALRAQLKLLLEQPVSIRVRRFAGVEIDAG